MTDNEAMTARVQFFINIWKLTDKDDRGKAGSITWNLHNLHKSPGHKSADFWDSFLDLSEDFASIGFLSKSVVDAVIEDDMCPGHLRKRMNQLWSTSLKARRARERAQGQSAPVSHSAEADGQSGNGHDTSEDALTSVPQGNDEAASEAA